MTPAEIINEGRWDHALFTTYALSLSFYETQLHKLGLARNGCRDIQIIADVDGYELSLGERQSHRVGNEYRLTPACLPSGVFHPKLIWLAGKTIDLVLLGSGNLTFGGFGKNFECLNVIRSDIDGTLFSAIGEMLTQWNKRDNLRFAEEGWLKFWGERAQRLSADANVSENPTQAFIHSTVESVANQLIRRIGKRQAVAEIRCLSPFYDPDGKGILALAESLNAEKLTIGLLPGQDAHPFPFTRLCQTRVQIAAATVSRAEERRRLHAKVMEVHMEDGSIFVLSGSVNATRKSLQTTDNIETALLSYYPDSQASPFEWTRCELPLLYCRQDFRKAGIGERVVVSARVTDDGRIEGSLLMRSDPCGDWNGSLQRIDGVIDDLTVPVDSSGNFSVQLSNQGLFQYAAGLQLYVSKGTLSGTGWVHVEGLLMAARRGFLSPSTLIRLLGTDADENDEAELLRYLSVSAQRHLPAFSDGTRRRSGNIRAGENESDGDTPSVQVPLQWLTQASHATQGMGEDGEDPDPENSTLNTYIARIRQNLLRPPGRESSSSEDIDESRDDNASKREEKERLRKQKKVRQSLHDFDQKMQSLVDAMEAGSNRSAALCMWHEATLPILLRRLSEAAEAEIFLGRWLLRALSCQRLSNSSETLSHHLVSALLTLAAIQLQRASPTMRKSLARLHEQLEDFCEGTDSQQLCKDLEVTGDSLGTPQSAEILNFLPDAPDLSTTLLSLLSVPTVRSQIQKILGESGDCADALPDELPILEHPAGQKLIQMVNAGRRPKKKTLGPNAKSCPHCYLKLRTGTLLEVNRDRFGFCNDCDNLLLASV